MVATVVMTVVMVAMLRRRRTLFLIAVRARVDHKVPRLEVVLLQELNGRRLDDPLVLALVPSAGHRFFGFSKKIPR